MGIGSFLAGAGQIGATAEDFVNKREVQRAARAEAQARQLELARTEKLRQGVIAMPDLSAEGPMYNLGAPGAVEDVGARRPAGITPVGTGTGTGAAPPVSVTPPAVAAKPAVLPAKAGLETDVYPFRAYAPGESDFNRAGTRMANTKRLDDTLLSLSQQTDVFGATLRKPFASQSRKVEITNQEAASDWYVSAAAKKYFRDYPQALTEAQKNPLGFYQSLQQKNRERDAAAAKTKAAAPKAAQTQQPAFDTGSFLNRVKAVESGGNYNTPNLAGTSSAFGAYQITKDTWLGTYKKLNPRSGMSDEQIWNLRRDPAAQDQVAGALAQTNANTLRNAGLPVNDSSMYLAWFLGGDGAKRLLGADVTTPVSRVVTPAQMKANRSVLEGRTVGDVIDWANGKMTGQRGGAAPAGVQQSAAQVTSAAQDRIDPSNFYLSNPTAISRDTSNAIQARQELTQMANLYRQSGMVGEFTQARAALREADNNIRMLQGMQGITEMAMANDPRRLAAVWSDYAGTPIQIQPRTDGTFNIVVNGKVAQQGVDRSSLVDTARSTFDRAYLQQRVETQSAVAMERLKGQLKIDEATATGLMQAAREIEVARINGDYNLAKQKIANLEEKIFATPGGDTYLRSGGTWQQLVPNYRAPGLPEDVPAGPAAVPIAGLTQRTVSVGSGG